MIGLSKWRVIDNTNSWVGFYEERIESEIFKPSRREKSITILSRTNFTLDYFEIHVLFNSIKKKQRLFFFRGSRSKICHYPKFRKNPECLTIIIIKEKEKPVPPA